MMRISWGLYMYCLLHCVWRLEGAALTPSEMHNVAANEYGYHWITADDDAGYGVKVTLQCIFGHADMILSTSMSVPGVVQPMSKRTSIEDGLDTLLITRTDDWYFGPGQDLAISVFGYSNATYRLWVESLSTPEPSVTPTYTPNIFNPPNDTSSPPNIAIPTLNLFFASEMVISPPQASYAAFISPFSFGISIAVSVQSGAPARFQLGIQRPSGGLFIAAYDIMIYSDKLVSLPRSSYAWLTGKGQTIYIALRASTQATCVMSFAPLASQTPSLTPTSTRTPSPSGTLTPQSTMPPNLRKVFEVNQLSENQTVSIDTGPIYFALRNAANGTYRLSIQAQGSSTPRMFYVLAGNDSQPACFGCPWEYSKFASAELGLTVSSFSLSFSVDLPEMLWLFEVRRLTYTRTAIVEPITIAVTAVEPPRVVLITQRARLPAAARVPVSAPAIPSVGLLQLGSRMSGTLVRGQPRSLQFQPAENLFNATGAIPTAEGAYRISLSALNGQISLHVNYSSKDGGSWLEREGRTGFLDALSLTFYVSHDNSNSSVGITVDALIGSPSYTLAIEKVSDTLYTDTDGTDGVPIYGLAIAAVSLCFVIGVVIFIVYRPRFLWYFMRYPLPEKAAVAHGLQPVVPTISSSSKPHGVSVYRHPQAAELRQSASRRYSSQKVDRAPSPAEMVADADATVASDISIEIMQSPRLLPSCRSRGGPVARPPAEHQIPAAELAALPGTLVEDLFGSAIAEMQAEGATQ